MMNANELAQALLKKARDKGATEGDVLVVGGDSFSVRVRLGEIDKLEHAREHQLGLRLFFGKRSAVTSTSDLSPSSLDRLLEDTCALAQSTVQDLVSGLPGAGQCVNHIQDLDLWDPQSEQLSMDEKIQLARRVEAAALSYDPRITNSEGGSFDHYTTDVLYVNTHGFCGQYKASGFSISAVPVAAENGSMQRDYWYSYRRRFEQLETAEKVGQTASMRTLRRLGARKVKTQIAPVVFDPLMAAKLISNIAAAVSGYAVYKGTSFLAGKLGKQVSNSQVTLFDDGTLLGGLGSKPFDGEGLATRKTAVIEGGILRSYLLDTYSARKLGMSSTGNAARSVGDSPTVSPHNFYLVSGSWSPEQILQTVKSGLYVTELIGFGVNLTTGDFSQGAAGLWIERGELAYPVEEITIAGNLNQMLSDIEMIGNDLELHRKVSAPTLKISRMTIAGA
jgi:PmbA protein